MRRLPAKKLARTGHFGYGSFMEMTFSFNEKTFTRRQIMLPYSHEEGLAAIAFHRRKMDIFTPTWSPEVIAEARALLDSAEADIKADLEASPL
jgi:hypothetical protein